jgi:hypothetical protein
MGATDMIAVSIILGIVIGMVILLLSMVGALMVGIAWGIESTKGK